MAGSTISTPIYNGITLGTVSSPGTYASPLTITNTGTVNSGTAGQAILGPSGNAWSVANYGTVQGGGGDGITFASGGNVANSVSAAYTGSISGYTGVDIRGAAGTVANSGVITGSGIASGAAGVILYAGGTLSNAASGSITGGFDGVFITGASGTVSNLGTITGNGRNGVALGLGGTVINGAPSATGALIAGNGLDAVFVNALPGTTGTVFNYGTLTAAADGVALITGGLVENIASGTAGGRIDVTDYGVRVLNATGTVVNSGTIISHGYQQVGVYLGAGGSVSNSGYIYGFNAAVRVAVGAGTVVNSGTIVSAGVGDSSPAGYGIKLLAGGTVTNIGSSALMAGRSYGVEIGGAAGTVTNSGTITASLNTGVFLTYGGVIDNQAGGRIEGYQGLQFYNSNFAGTLTNAGTIIGHGRYGGGPYGQAAIFFDGGTAVNSAYALISGTELGLHMVGGPGTVDNAGTIAGGSIGVNLTSGGTVTNSGTILGTNPVPGEYQTYFNGLYGIYSDGNITVTNAANALIQGDQSGVYVRGDVGTIINSGTIIGGPTTPIDDYYYGVYLEFGGTVTNAANALIEGSYSGISMYDAGGTVDNRGTIIGGYYGVYMDGAGVVTNAANALIQGGETGVYIEFGYGTVSNFGTIVGTSRYGVYIDDGGSVSNGAGALIQGGDTASISADSGRSVTRASSSGPRMPASISRISPTRLAKSRTPPAHRSRVITALISREPER